MGIWRAILRHPSGRIGAAIIVLFVVLALLGGSIPLFATATPPSDLRIAEYAATHTNFTTEDLFEHLGIDRPTNKQFTAARRELESLGFEQRRVNASEGPRPRPRLWVRR